MNFSHKKSGTLLMVWMDIICWFARGLKPFNFTDEKLAKRCGGVIQMIRFVFVNIYEEIT